MKSIEDDQERDLCKRKGSLPLGLLAAQLLRAHSAALRERPCEPVVAEQDLCGNSICHLEQDIAESDSTKFRFVDKKVGYFGVAMPTTRDVDRRKFSASFRKTKPTSCWIHPTGNNASSSFLAASTTWARPANLESPALEGAFSLRNRCLSARRRWDSLRFWVAATRGLGALTFDSRSVTP